MIIKCIRYNRYVIYNKILFLVYKMLCKDRQRVDKWDPSITPLPISKLNVSFSLPESCLLN